MRRGTLAVALLLAVLYPVPSPAEGAPESGASGVSAAAAEGEAAASDGAAEGGEKAAKAADEASQDGEAAEPSPEASGDEAASDESGASGDAEEASGDESGAPEEAAADDSEGGGGSGERESFFTPFVDYASNVRTQFLTGLNGMLTCPADPVMATVNPPKAFDKAGYPRRPLGFGSGVLLMAYRTFTGTLDLALAPGPLPVLSPVPRYHLIPG